MPVIPVGASATGIDTSRPSIRVRVLREEMSTATRWHKNIGQWLVLGLVALHVTALVVHRLRGHPPLVTPMLTGDKLLEAPAPASRDDAVTRTLALALLIAAGLAVAWVFGLSAAGGGGVY